MTQVIKVTLLIELPDNAQVDQSKPPIQLEIPVKQDEPITDPQAYFLERRGVNTVGMTKLKAMEVIASLKADEEKRKKDKIKTLNMHGIDFNENDIVLPPSPEALPWEHTIKRKRGRPRKVRI